MEARDITAFVSRLIAPLSRRIALTVSRGVVKLVYDAFKMQGVQVELVADELQDQVEHFQEYGFTSHAKEGAEAVFLSVGGNRGHGIVVCVSDRRYRPVNMAEGDVCLFNEHGERVYLDNVADLVHLGAKAGAEFVALATKTQTEMNKIVSSVNALRTAISGWAPVAQDGGAALKAALTSWLAQTLTVNAPAATKVKGT
jgi:phage baseplate assembly protein V